MTATLIDGKMVAGKILNTVAREVKKMKRIGKAPKLAFILVGNNPASLAYVGQKKKACEKVGIAYTEIVLPLATTTAQLVEKIQILNKNKAFHGILVQLPLPRHIDEPQIIKAIDPYKDVDGFHA
ncbi:MAG: tetrahydrofolate dehydrogenase/cyclohydrolase catalytic domain-containing protein, partial [Patescibacteria group bacterium]